MAKRARKAAKRTTPKRAKRARNPQSTAVQSARPKPRKPKSGERQADKPKSETAGLKNQLRAAEDRQTATADILKVIASSPSDVQPVFEAMVASANRLIGGYATAVLRFIDGYGHLAAFTPINPDADEKLKAAFPQRIADVPMLRPAQAGEVLQIDDTEKSHERLRDIARARGFRSVLYVPLKSKETSIGVIATNRRTPGPFSAHDVRLLQTFADQAVIAIENARLFNETQEALERQTATTDILKVIASSPDDVQPVFEAVAASANRLLGGFSSTVFRFIDGMAHLKAFTPTTPEADEILLSTFPRPVADFAPFQMTQAGEVMQIPDTEAPTYELKEIARARGYRSMLYAPLMNKGVSIGFIAVTRVQAGSFADHHIQLLQTFAEQAVIAIENVRLFDEVQARTRDLTESLEQQTATAEILSSISASMTDTKPVFDAIVRNLRRLFHTRFAVLQTLRDDGMVEMPAVDGPGIEKLVERYPRPLANDTVGGLAMLSRRPMQFAPVLNNPDTPVTTQQFARDFGFNSLNFSPMLLGDKVVGAIGVAHEGSTPFDEKQIALIGSFAKQAVIAIENTRLLKELRKRTDDLSESLEQQTATSEVLEVISASTGELEPVFKNMLDNATRICGANFGTMSLYENGAFRPVAFYNVPQAYAEKYADTLIRPHPQGPLGTVARTHEVVHVEDTKSLPVYIEGNPAIVAISDLAGARTIVIVPMLRENELIGTIAIYRQEVRSFSQKQISLLTNFAKQAVIAIENTRLLKELRQRTGDLSQSLDDLRSAQDRLVQTEKLASLGQLTAGIAHEIKNPLNFVNNFSALSAELTDELNDVLKPVAMDGKVREEVDELTGLLKDNLEKVVQHGKRADSIVKNMLLHSREGSREHRPADINSLLDESLNLAYHGARAEKGEFNITLQRDFDADAGTIELFPQEITRAFLNLIANGVYAATKRKTEEKELGFEPTLRATTKNLGTSVEIRIRDNGTGIPAEVQEKMFNPFFTTKPAGEGTGLGLSMTHDIIVKQHGGRIDVATEPGQFTEFTIVLPRKSDLPGGDRGKT